VITKTGSK